MLDSAMPEWPPELDALVAAPKHHRVLLENDRVRVVETTVQPGDTVPVHTHEWGGVSTFLSWSALVRRDGDGVVVLDSRELGLSREPGSVAWQDPLPAHSLENVGGHLLHVITVELKPDPTSSPNS